MKNLNRLSDGRLYGIVGLMGLFACFVWGCDTKPKDQQPPTVVAHDIQAPASFVVDTVLVSDTSCKGSAFACTYVMLEYPRLLGVDSTSLLAQNLKLGVAQSTGLPSAGKVGATMASVGKAFLDSFNLEKKQSEIVEPSRHLSPWFLEVSANVSQERGLVFLNTDMFMFTGGAHPFAANTFQAFDRQTGQRVSYETFLPSDAGRKEVERLAKARFETQEGIQSKDDYQGFFFKDHTFALPSNWRVVDDSLEFVYNLYEIKPYAAGFTYLKVPLNGLDSLLAPAYRRPRS